MNPNLRGEARATGGRLDPKYAPLLVPTIMAVAMSFVMSLVMTTARLGFAPHLVSAWLTSFAIGVSVAIPTAIIVSPSAQRLVGHLTGAPLRSMYRRASSCTDTREVPSYPLTTYSAKDPDLSIRAFRDEVFQQMGQSRSHTN